MSDFGVKKMFEVRNEDGQIISTHATAKEAHKFAARYRNDRAMGWSLYQVFGPVAESNR